MPSAVESSVDSNSDSSSVRLASSSRRSVARRSFVRRVSVTSRQMARMASGLKGTSRGFEGVFTVGHRQRVVDGDRGLGGADASDRVCELRGHGRRQYLMHGVLQEGVRPRVQRGIPSTAIVEDDAVGTDEEQEIRKNIEAGSRVAVECCSRSSIWGGSYHPKAWLALRPR